MKTLNVGLFAWACPWLSSAFVTRSRPRGSALRAAATEWSTESFAALVERKVCARFGADAVERVLASWRLLDEGYEHAAALDDGSNPFMRQEARSYLPGLTPQPFWDVSDQPWAGALRENWQVVRDEFRAVALADPESLQRKGNNIWASAADQGSAQSYGPEWRTLVLMDRTTWDPTNCVLFPRTAQLLEEAGVPCVEAFFASMKPNSKINPHSDSCNFVLTSHLGIQIPHGGVDADLDDKTAACRITVGDKTRAWRDGEVMMFDTSIFHDAVNEAEESRYILMLRVWHPELTRTEREALQFLFDCLDVPELLSDDPIEVFRAESQIASLRTRPTKLPRAPASSSTDKKPAPARASARKAPRKNAKQRGFGVAK